MPLRIVVLSRRWEPARVTTPRFIDAWTCNEEEATKYMVHVVLDANCENVVVWRPGDLKDRQRNELFVGQGDISYCRVYAKSGSGRENKEPSSDIDKPETSDAGLWTKDMDGARRVHLCLQVLLFIY